MTKHARKLSVRHAIAWVVAAACSCAALPATARQDDAPWCFDAVVVANTLPRPSADDGRSAWIAAWVWTLDAVVQEVVFGDFELGQTRLRTNMHTEIRVDRPQVLFFLRREPDGSWLVINMAPRVLHDSLGRYVIPLAEPADREWLYPHPLLDDGYQSLLQPISYLAKEASWLWVERWDEDNLAALSPDWATVEGDYVVARRGIPVRDLVDHALALPGARCESAA